MWGIIICTRAHSEFDEDLGWNDFALRNYDPQRGQWLQMDPYDQFASPYVGMGNDPVNLIDPSGGVVEAFMPVTELADVVVTAAKRVPKIIGLGAHAFTTVSNVLQYYTYKAGGSETISYSYMGESFFETSSQQTMTLSGVKQEVYYSQVEVTDQYLKAQKEALALQEYYARAAYKHVSSTFNFAQYRNGFGMEKSVRIPRPHEALGDDLVGQLFGAYALGKPLETIVSSLGVAAKGGGTFYRAMGNAEFAALESSGGLSHMAGKELFVSSSANYSRAYLQKSGYDVLVKFNMKPGAMNYFNQVGVMHRTAAGASGWAGRGSLLWKSEQGVMNLGIQSNTHMFNPWINSFKVIK